MRALALFALWPAAALAQAAPWTLDRLQQAARSNDPRARVAEAEVDKMRALRAQADAARLPQLQYLAFGGAPVPEERNDPNHLDAVLPVSRLGNGQFGNWGYLAHLDATLAQPLYTFGKIDAWRRAAGLGVDATSALLDEARVQAARDAAEAFWGYQLARALAEGIDSARGQLADARKRVEQLVAARSTQASHADLHELEMLDLELQARRVQAEQGMDLAVEAARLLAGAEPGAPFALAAAPLEPAPLALAPLDAYAAAALDGQPEVLAARAGEKARAALATEKWRELLPDVLVVGMASVSYSNAATRQTNPFAYDPYNQRSAGLALALKGDLDFFQHRAAAQQADAEAEGARATRELAEKGARLRVAKAWGAMKAALERARIVKEEAAAARRWLTAAQLGFDAGTGEVKDVLLAALAAAYAAGESLAAAHDAELALADLSLAVGRDARTVPAASPGAKP